MNYKYRLVENEDEGSFSRIKAEPKVTLIIPTVADKDKNKENVKINDKINIVNYSDFLNNMDLMFENALEITN
jgi:hypothetical protein